MKVVTKYPPCVYPLFKNINDSGLPPYEHLSALRCGAKTSKNKCRNKESYCGCLREALKDGVVKPDISYCEQCEQRFRCWTS